MSSTTPDRRAWIEVLVVPLAAGLLMSAIGYWPTAARAGRAGVEAMVVAQAMMLAIVYATLLPIVWKVATADGPGRMVLAFKAAGRRFILTLLAAGAFTWLEPVDRTVFLVWMGMGYVVLTLAETIALVRWMSKTEKQACT